MKNKIPKLKIAVSQFPVESDIEANMKYIQKHIAKAVKEYADVVHFPELALSGYDTEIDKIDWELLDTTLEGLQETAKEKGIYIIIGAHVKNQKNRKPYNATLLISDKGRIEDNYVKTKLYKDELKRFSIKDSLLVHKIKGVKCGFLICYESCFSDLFQKYRDAGVKVLFLSYYNARSSKPKNSMGDLMRSQFVTRATDNLMYISGSNSSAKYSRMPSSFVSPDGKVVSAKRHMPGIIIGEYPSPDLGWTYDNQK